MGTWWWTQYLLHVYICWRKAMAIKKVERKCNPETLSLISGATYLHTRSRSWAPCHQEVETVEDLGSNELSIIVRFHQMNFNLLLRMFSWLTFLHFMSERLCLAAFLVTILKKHPYTIFEWCCHVGKIVLWVIYFKICTNEVGFWIMNYLMFNNVVNVKVLWDI